MRQRSLRAKARVASRFLPEAMHCPVVAVLVPEAVPELLPSFEELFEGALAPDGQDPDADVESEERPSEVPAPPPSHVRAILPRKGKRQDKRSPYRYAQQMDRDRRFDFRLIALLRDGIVTPEGMRMLRYFPSLQCFIRRTAIGGWSAEAKDRLATLGGTYLWDKDGASTVYGEELWRLFRLRERREGAIEAIVARAFGRTERRAA